MPSSSSSKTRIRVIPASGGSVMSRDKNRIVVVSITYIPPRRGRSLIQIFNSLENRYPKSVSYDKIIQRVEDESDRIIEESCIALVPIFLIDKLERYDCKIIEYSIAQPARGGIEDVYYLKLGHIYSQSKYLKEADIKADLEKKLQCVARAGCMRSTKSVNVKLFQTENSAYAYIHMRKDMEPYVYYLTFTWLSNIYWNLEGIDPLTKMAIVYSSNPLRNGR
jgi:hypothetical protein